MTVEELVERAKSLTPQQREELAERVLRLNAPAVPPRDTAHWGQSLNELMDAIGPIELKYPDIEDPVEWVAAQRKKRQDQLWSGGDAAYGKP